MTNYYKIGNIVIKVNYDFDYDDSYGYLQQFKCSEVKYDYEFTFQLNEDVSIYNDLTYEFKDEYGFVHTYFDTNKNENTLFEYNNYYLAYTHIDDNTGFCHYVSFQYLKESINSGRFLENYMCIDKILRQFNAHILHSCHICYNNTSILFSAPSGTGKSTQGYLWQQYQNATIINGDRTIIRKDDVYKAYGSPFSGTSGISLNREHPLGCIVVLRQAPYNKVTRLNAFHAFKAVYSEMTVPKWDSNAINQSFDFVEHMISEVPVYLLECTKEQEAVDTLYQQLSKDGVL